jgi:hypothetical protein
MFYVVSFNVGHARQAKIERTARHFLMSALKQWTEEIVAKLDWDASRIFPIWTLFRLRMY